MQTVRRPSLIAVLVIVMVGCAAPTSTSPAPGMTSDSSSQPRGSQPAPVPGASSATDPTRTGASPGSPPVLAAEGVPSFDGWPSDWPPPPDVPLIDPDDDVAAAAIPQPVTMEPFAIGEALYDPARVPVAFVSLLDRMGIGIDAADGTPIRPGDAQGAGGLRLDEGIVASLIAKGVDDAAAGAVDGDLPFTFADLARALEPLLPGWDADRLAEAYDEAYQADPDALIAQVMLGQPIEATTPLTRPQIWLLFVDGFVRPADQASLPGLHVAAAGPGWGAAGGPLPSINEQLARDGALMMGLDGLIPFTMTPSTASGHEGHGGLGPAIRLTAAVGRARSHPGSMIMPRPTASISTRILWTADADFLNEHGTIGTALGVEHPFMGQAAFDYRIRREPGRPVGPVVSRSTKVTAWVPQQDLVSGAYQIPAAHLGFLFGTVKTTGGRIRVAWHGQEGVELRLQNEFDLVLGDGDVLSPIVTLGVPFAGSAAWDGTDSLSGFLEKQPNGTTYRGSVIAAVDGTFAGSFGGYSCRLKYRGTQQVQVTGREIDNGLRLQLTFTPETAPLLSFTDRTSDAPELCEEENWYVPHPNGVSYLPFAVGNWTQGGYAVANPDRFTPEWHYEDTEDDDPADAAGFGTWTWRVATKLVARDP